MPVAGGAACLAGSPLSRGGKGLKGHNQKVSSCAFDIPPSDPPSGVTASYSPSGSLPSGGDRGFSEPEREEEEEEEEE